MPTQSTSHCTTSSNSASQTSVKAHRALTLFDALRASVQDSTLQIPHVTPKADAAAASASNNRTHDAAQPSSSASSSRTPQPIAATAAAGEAALMRCGSAELRHRLLVTEAANKTLCVKNAQLMRQVRQLEEALAKAQRELQDTRSNTSTTTTTTSTVRERELSDAVRSLTNRLASEQAAREAAESGTVALQQRVQSLELHKEQLAARLFAALHRPTSSSSHGGNDAVRDGKQLHSEPTKQKKAVSGVNALSKPELDRMLDAQRRLAQLQQQYNALLDVPLAAVLNEAAQSTTTSIADCDCVNAEVKKLFAAMRERLRAQEVQQERERARMNVTLYSLEQRLATLEM